VGQEDDNQSINLNNSRPLTNAQSSLPHAASPASRLDSSPKDPGPHQRIVASLALAPSLDRQRQGRRGEDERVPRADRQLPQPQLRQSLRGGLTRRSREWRSSCSGGGEPRHDCTPRRTWGEERRRHGDERGGRRGRRGGTHSTLDMYSSRDCLSSKQRFLQVTASCRSRGSECLGGRE
jgi:hypothetical protein